MKTKVLALSLITLMLGLFACQPQETKEQKLTRLKQELKLKEKSWRSLEKEIEEIQVQIASLEEEEDTVIVIPVNVDTLSLAEFNHYVKVQGQIYSDNNILVSPKMQGVVTSVRVQTGQRVSKGQTLATLDNSILQSTIAELNTQLEVATTVYNKQKRLWDQKIGSEIQYIEAKANMDALKKRIATTQEQLAMSYIAAPISGTVDDVMLKVGEAAIPGMGAFRIVNQKDMTFKAELSEAYIPYVKKGDQVSIFFETVRETITGKIMAISQTINPINRTITIEVALPNNNMLKTNMIGEISINDYKVEKAIVINLSNTLREGEENFVFVVAKDSAKNQIAKKRKVTLGKSYKDLVLVESGLKQGDILITTDGDGLSEGQLITFGAQQAKTEDQKTTGQNPDNKQESPKEATKLKETASK